MDKNTIIQAMEAEIARRGCFLVDVSVKGDDEITLVIESAEGTVTMDDCVALSEAFQARFDRDVEDYALTVTSAGLDQPFRVLQQYQKAVGTQVEVRLKGGRRLEAVLEAADPEAVTVRYSALETVEGKKKRVRVEHTERIPYAQVNAVLPVIDFE